MDTGTGTGSNEEQMVSLRVQNARDVSVTFHLEPWGEQYRMPPGATFEVIARGPREDTLELEYTDDAILLYGWTGSTVSVFYAGKEISTPAYHQQA